MEYYIHHVPGRLRVKIPLLKHRPGVAQEIHDLLDLHGVIDIKIQNITGSVVVNYNPELIQAQQLLKILSDCGYYDGSKAITIDDQVRKATSNASAKVGKALFGWGVSKTLEANGLSLLAVLI